MAEKNKKLAPVKSKKLEREITSPVKRIGTRLGLMNPKIQTWVYLIILSGTISLLLFPNTLMLSKENYSLGDVARKNIKAPRDFLVEDKELTKQRKDEAIKSSLFVYDFDRSAAYTSKRIKESFAYGREELERIQSTELESALRSEKRRQLREEFFELSGVNADPVLFDQLMKNGFSPQIENTVLSAANRIFQRGVVGDNTVLMSQKGKGIILRDIDSQTELKVDDLGRFYDPESARQHISQIIDQSLTQETELDTAASIERFGQLLIRPNITFNKRETELRKEEAKNSVKPIYFQVKKGEMIVREGEKINPTHLLKLETQAQLTRNTLIPGMALSTTLMIGIMLALSYLIVLKRPNVFKENTRNLTFLSVALLFIFLVVLLYNVVAEEVARGFPFFTAQVLLFALPISLGAILVCIFQGLDVAIGFSLIISILASIAVEGKVEFLIYFLLGSLLAAYGVRNCRERMVLIKTGIRVGLLNMALALLIQTLYGNLYSPTSALSIIAGFLGGALAGVIATGFLPLIEMAFGFTTDIKLLELSSLDQPILKDLMVNAPGTYHHSVVVSNMVEATAESIHANPLLAKVSAYYHDIGKIKKPLYFVENQARGENRHEKLAPSMSSLILISHVKDGVELAKQQRLGKEIIDTIEQHHGTSLISYFYEKAKDQSGKKGGRSSPVKEQDFRYPGPRPQTKEVALVLLADAVEAASRTLVDPTPARIQGMVQKIMNGVFSDGQLDECELTLKDLNQIAKSFTKTLSGIFHGRVEYPEPIAKGKAGQKRENGDSNNVPPSHEKGRSRKGKDEANEDLKRLGMP
ncbi:MAG: HDIG domain-containing protein [Deltaproteobacteria bacterium]|nr:HDIG domain-containing protein [Deltaproteobacteria bacterium]MBW2339571.1 HDIG domain-containing protein [Deltaproteobacteria bacterium]